MEKQNLLLKMSGKEERSKNLSTTSSFNVISTDRKQRFIDITSTKASSKRDSYILLSPRALKEESKIEKKLNIVNQSSIRDEPIKIIDVVEDANNYLNIEGSEFLFNENFSPGPRYDSNNKLIPYSYVGSSNIFKSSYPYLVKGLSAFQNNINPKFFPHFQFKMKNNQAKKNKGVELIVNDNEIKEKKFNINEFMKNLPKDLKRSINIQENLFKSQEKKQKQEKILEKFLCEKTKKDQDQLLNKKNSSHNLKNVIFDIADIKKNSFDNGFINKWISSLRSGNNKGERDISYINIGNTNSPIWTVIPQKNRKDKDIVGYLNESNCHAIDTLLRKKVIKKVIKDNEIDLDKFRVFSSLKVISNLKRSKGKIF